MSTRIVIVTGAFGILGAAVAARFEEQGDRVARIDYAPVPADATDCATGLAIGGVDLADEAQASGAFERICAELGTPSVLVNVAGGFIWETLADGGAKTWERMFRMNALTATTMCKAALPALSQQAGAAIVNIGAGAAGKADAGMGAYAASKAAVARLTESLAAELAGADVTVNAVLPTVLDTPTNRADMPDADFSQWVMPGDVAQVIAFLASNAARCVSGASIPVSRGTSGF
ncbi:SDR family NAD(P)-dependent oxidoreductase [Novosphingobium sp. YJ-S2-02]|uniref:SDR family NAD(P)-dependent oxidoreductase n=1 Tax=Novosphingobium aureum TaxID=2792964 RepID=A0A931MMG0_9SPHN|nr:SDR family NAD(P)-dependent oxidoreductase [Novosphingobium aureum]MBH0114399.1 SDR family NAD(P)-dependent oxidoreductase [Novosphingobium aureum]